MARLSWIAVVLVATALSACGSSGAADKAGGAAPAIQLRVATAEQRDRPTGLQLARFATALEAASKGRIRVQIDYEAGSDADLISRVSRGDVAIALVASRAFTDAGVRGLEALQAPMLVDSDALAAAVATDRDLTAGLFSGLGAAHLAGLALTPENVRHPVGFHRPFVTPGDFRGATVRVVPSSDTAALFETLGARTGSWDDAEYAARVADGRIDLADISFQRAPSGLPELGVATGNVGLYTRMNVLIGNDRALSRLTGDQRAAVASAARTMQGWAIAHVEPDIATGPAYCAAGGEVTLASADQVEALRAAFQPRYTQLAADPATAKAIARIEELKRSTPAAPIHGCRPAAVALELWTGDTDDPSALDGVYRIEVTDADLKLVGDPESSWPEDHGVYTWTVRDGKMRFRHTAPNPLEHPDVTLCFSVRGDAIQVVDCNSGPGAIMLEGTWRKAGDGSLRFRYGARGRNGAAIDELWFGKLAWKPVS